MRSNDLFDRANQRKVGLIGRVRKLNSPYGRAQRGRTIIIPAGYFPIFYCLYTLFKLESKVKICLKSKEMKYGRQAFHGNKDQKPGG